MVMNDKDKFLQQTFEELEASIEYEWTKNLSSSMYSTTEWISKLC